MKVNNLFLEEFVGLSEVYSLVLYPRPSKSAMPLKSRDFMVNVSLGGKEREEPMLVYYPESCAGSDSLGLDSPSESVVIDVHGLLESTLDVEPLKWSSLLPRPRLLLVIQEHCTNNVILWSFLSFRCKYISTMDSSKSRAASRIITLTLKC